VENGLENILCVLMMLMNAIRLCHIEARAQYCRSLILQPPQVVELVVTRVQVLIALPHVVNNQI